MYARVDDTPAQDAPSAQDDAAPAGVGQVRGALAGLGDQFGAARALLDRPLTSYYLIAGITTLLLSLGLVMVLSTASWVDLSQGESPYHDFVVQLAGIVVGVPLMWVAARCNPRLFRAAAYPLLAVSAIGLCLVLIPGVGRSVNGATRWIAITGSLRFQPSELAKLALAVWGADLLARKEKIGMLADWRHMLVPLLPGTGVLALLVMGGDDLGTTSILLIIFLALLWFIGTPGRVFAGLLILMGLVLLLLMVTQSYRVKRLTGFWDTTNTDPTGTNMQAIQGRYALGSGGIFGVGLGASREKWGWLPESTSDFIFAIIGEELGLVGTFCVTALYGGLAFAGLRVARRAPDTFSRLLSAVITVWIVGQAVVNIGAVIGVFPITGVPLPLVSQGLSSVLVTMIGLGMLMSFARREPGASHALAARGPSPGGRALSWLRQGTRRGTLGNPAAPRGPPRQEASQAMSEERAMRVVLAGGGSAGHIEPALALADALREADSSIWVTCLGTERGLETRLVPLRGYDLELIPAVPLPRSVTPALLTVPGRLAGAVHDAGRILDRLHADVLVGFGGYVATPAYLAARRHNVPIVVHEANPYPGIANRLGARLTTHVFTAHPDTKLRNAKFIGMPIRRQIADLDRFALGDKARAYFGLRPDLPVLLVFGGSQGAKSLNRALAGAVDAITTAGVQILHVTGPKNAAESQRSDRPPSPGAAPYVTVPYVDRMDLAYAAADFALCRAGANTCAELTAVGLPAAYVPLPIGNGEQRLNALPIVQRGGGLLVEDAELTADWIKATLLPVLTNIDQVAGMSEAATALGRKDADRWLAKAVIDAVAAERARAASGREAGDGAASAGASAPPPSPRPAERLQPQQPQPGSQPPSGGGRHRAR